jgi:hypothetical protein
LVVSVGEYYKQTGENRLYASKEVDVEETHTKIGIRLCSYLLSTIRLLLEREDVHIIGDEVNKAKLHLRRITSIKH